MSDETKVMTKKERDAVRRSLDAPRWKCTNCGHMEKGHLKGDAQSGRPCRKCGERHLWTGSFSESADHRFSPRAELRRALDTIDALESRAEKAEREREELRNKLTHAEQRRDLHKREARRLSARGIEVGSSGGETADNGGGPTE